MSTKFWKWTPVSTNADGPLSDEEFRRRADDAVENIARMIESLADEHGLTTDQVWKQFVDFLVDRAITLDPEGNPLPQGYDPAADPSHPMHGWKPGKDEQA